MAAKRPYRALDAFLTRCGKIPGDITGLSYDPSTGAVSVTIRPVPFPVAAQPESEAEESKDGDEPIDFRFALERFNDSPKRRAQ